MSKELIAGSAALATITEPGPIRGTLGEQRMLAVLINGIHTPEYAYRMLLDEGALHSIAHYYRYVSGGKVWFVGDIVEVTMDMPTTCDYPEIARRAVAAAIAQCGIDIDYYTRHIYIGAFACPTYGIGSLGQGMTSPGGTRYGSVWLRGINTQVHEMGHSFGLAHANGADGTEYGDTSDVMGVSSREFNAPHQVQLGWIAETVQEVTADGEFEILPLEWKNLTSGIQVLKIPKPDTGEFYWISYRQPIGPYDGSFYTTYIQGAWIHVWTFPNTTYGGNVTKVIDTTPGSSGGRGDAPLTDGRTYSANGVNITQIAHSPDGVRVRVSFGSAPPPPPPIPILSIVPQTVTLRAGQSQQFTANAAGVTWKLSGIGSLTETGLYTAPERILRRTTATIMANDAAGSAYAAVTLMKGKG